MFYLRQTQKTKSNGRDLRGWKRPILSAIIFASMCVSANLLPEAAAASRSAPAANGACEISGWSATAEEDGRKIAVRAKPSARARMKGKLPTDDANYAGPKPRHLAEFDIVEARSGWFRIANVQILAIQDASYDAYPSKITGWVEGSAIRFNIQSSRGFAIPSSDSAVLVTSPDWVMGGWMGLYDCDGKWVQVETTRVDPADPYPDRDLPQRKAWFRGVCGNSMIGCDDVSGD
jgi:hypothetical protein